MSKLLEGKVAVVSGSAVGIGRGVSVRLAEEGADIVALDVNSVENRATAEAVRATGRQCLPIACDVADRVQVRSAIDAGLQAFGRIDVLVNNAAVWDDSSLLNGTYESQTAAFEASMGACAMGSYYCARACVPAMAQAGGGHIINIITEHVKEGHYITGMPALGYDCAKFSQWRQTETWAMELADVSIRVNGLCFGATDSPMLRGAAPELADSAMKPADIGQAIINLIAHGEAGPSGETYLFGTSGTPRAESLAAIAALAPTG